MRHPWICKTRLSWMHMATYRLTTTVHGTLDWELFERHRVLTHSRKHTWTACRIVERTSGLDEPEKSYSRAQVAPDSTRSCRYLSNFGRAPECKQSQSDDERLCSRSEGRALPERFNHRAMMPLFIHAQLLVQGSKFRKVIRYRVYR